MSLSQFFYQLYCLFDVHSSYFTHGSSSLSDNNVGSLIRVKHLPRTRSSSAVLLPGRSLNSALHTPTHVHYSSQEEVSRRLVVCGCHILCRCHENYRAKAVDSGAVHCGRSLRRRRSHTDCGEKVVWSYEKYSVLRLTASPLACSSGHHNDRRCPLSVAVSVNYSFLLINTGFTHLFWQLIPHVNVTDTATLRPLIIKAGLLCRWKWSSDVFCQNWHAF